VFSVELRFRCDYFFDLDPVISGRASTKPLHTRDQRNPKTQADLEDIFAAGVVAGNALSQETNHISGHQVRDENPDEERPYSKSDERARKDNQPNTVIQPLGTTCDKLGEGDDNLESFLCQRGRGSIGLQILATLLRNAEVRQAVHVLASLHQRRRPSQARCLYATPKLVKGPTNSSCSCRC